jgi:hypothetical protein
MLEAPAYVPASPPQPAPPPRRLPTWLPLATVLLAVAGVLIAVGTSPWDILRYGLYAAWGILLPGTLVYRAVRKTPHSVVDDLAFGTATGVILELAAYALFSGLGLRPLLGLWPLLVVIPWVAVPALRRHWRPRYVTRTPLAWSWTVAAIAVFVLGYLTFAYLVPNIPVPTGGDRLYFHDQLYLLSLVGEAKHHFPLETPQVGGQALGYHWFAFAHMATSSLVTGVDTPVVFFRLAVPAMALLATLLLAVVGWRISGRPWVGALASALMFAVGELVAGTAAQGPLAGAMTFAVWNSQSLPYSWLIAFPLVAFAIDRLSGGLPDAPLGRGAWWLFGLFALAAPGAKASVLPVLGAGLGLAGVVGLLRRQPSWRPWALLGLVGLGQLFGLAVLYQFDSQGVVIRPFMTFGLMGVPQTFGWLALAVVAYVVYMLTRMAGAFLGRWGTTEWFLLGAVVAGAGGALLLAHPSLSQNNFMRSAFVFAALLSALGAVPWISRQGLPPRTLVIVTAGVLGLAAAGGAVLFKVGGGSGPLTPILRAGLLTFGVALLVWLVGRVRPRLRPVTSVAALLFVLLAGMPSIPLDAYKYPNAGYWYHTTVGLAQANATRWLRDNSDPAELVATNVHCVLPAPKECWHLNFYVSAFSERRLLVESWAYEQHTDEVSSATGAFPPTVDFQDPTTLAMNDAAITAPSPEAIAYIRTRGVRWLYVDRAYGRESPQLGQYATVRYDNERIAIYRLNA